MMAPLLLRQPCVTDVALYDGENFAYNLDAYRPITLSDRTKSLTRCHLEVVGREFDLSKPWLFNVNPIFKSPLVVSCTPRYHDRMQIDWSLLREFQAHVGFIGHDRDYAYFSEKAGFRPERIAIQNALEFASIIAGGKLFLGNQSLGFAIAEGLKHPRVLEVFHGAPNCMPASENGFTKLSTDTIRRYLFCPD